LASSRRLRQVGGPSVVRVSVFGVLLKRPPISPEILSFSAVVAIRPRESIKRYAGDAAALGQQFLLGPEVGGDWVGRPTALMIEIPPCGSRQLVLARGKPGLGFASLMEIVRC